MTTIKKYLIKPDNVKAPFKMKSQSPLKQNGGRDAGGDVKFTGASALPDVNKAGEKLYEEIASYGDATNAAGGSIPQDLASAYAVNVDKSTAQKYMDDTADNNNVSARDIRKKKRAIVAQEKMNKKLKKKNIGTKIDMIK
tara:strand:+ start:45 stop:464 length:420 start_codon:yes stop_codon:yes gene_type:complete